ncbi:hypothetical protein [Helicobacter sp. 16-1353]|uniref:hypothetical protein n=1 Tax=Helicobacter sp. 16-1353 TaxID=2004996 RepID=UPI0015EEA2A5|nr:hypothetical protein [Helicobacter sp. 16-1353]
MVFFPSQNMAVSVLLAFIVPLFINSFIVISVELVNLIASSNFSSLALPNMVALFIMEV